MEWNFNHYEESCNFIIWGNNLIINSSLVFNNNVNFAKYYLKKLLNFMMKIRLRMSKYLLYSEYWFCNNFSYNIYIIKVKYYLFYTYLYY